MCKEYSVIKKQAAKSEGALSNLTLNERCHRLPSWYHFPQVVTLSELFIITSLDYFETYI